MNNTFGKIFPEMFTGSMMGAGSSVFALWAYILANKNQFGELEININLVSVQLGDTKENVQNALNYLLQPDPESRTKTDDGRRLIHKGAYLYFVVNSEKYRSVNDVNKRQQYLREKKRESRLRAKISTSKVLTKNEKPQQKRVKLKPIVDNVDMSTMSTHTDTDTDTDKKGTISKEIESKVSDLRPLPEEALRWNVMVEERNKMSRVISMSPSRMKKLKLRRAMPDWDERYGLALEKINASHFCNGENDRGWTASFDWIINSDDNLLKVIEGKYDNRTNRPNNPTGKNQPSRFSSKLTLDDAKHSDYSNIGRNNQLPGPNAPKAPPKPNQ